MQYTSFITRFTGDSYNTFFIHLINFTQSVITNLFKNLEAHTVYILLLITSDEE